MIQKFKVGDRVKCTFFGDAVFTLETFQFSDGLIIKYGDNYVPFLADGKVHKSHTHPVLTLVERPKKKIQVTAWANIYRYPATGNISISHHPTEQDADDSALVHRIACVELTGEYEA